MVAGIPDVTYAEILPGKIVSSKETVVNQRRILRITEAQQ